MNAIEKVCKRCQPLFLAEPEDAGFSPICYDCDVKLHHEVDAILKERGHSRSKPAWFDDDAI